MIEQIFSIINLNFILIIFAGSLAGMFIGSMPGLSVTMATALLVSLTYTWDVNNALALIMGVFVVGVYSGAITAILINIPGAPSSVATTLDGFPMAKNGRSYLALKTATIYSFFGSVVGLIILSISAKPITKLALQFTPFDYFLLALFGLTTVGSLTSKSFIKGLISASIGVFLSTVGMDPIMGITRFTFNISFLQRGISIIPVLIGIFGFSEIFFQVLQKNRDVEIIEISKTDIKIKELLKYWKLGLKSSVIGTLIGALPGAGGPIAALISYDQAKRTTKNPEVPFGEGAVEGIVASEASNNGCIGGALIPMLTLGIPGDAVTAVILAAFYVHGLRPGPLLFSESPELFTVILVAGFIACITLLILGFTMAPILSKVVMIPKKILYPVISILCIIGSFAANNSVFDVLLMLIFGIIGFVMRKREFSVAPLVLGLVLGGLMDANFRRAVSLAMSSDNVILSMIFRPISIVLIVLIILSVLSSMKPFKITLKAE